MKDNRVYLAFILECIRDIHTFVDGDVQRLDEKRTLYAVERALQIMAESTQRLSPNCTGPIPRWNGTRLPDSATCSSTIISVSTSSGSGRSWTRIFRSSNGPWKGSWRPSRIQRHRRELPVAVPKHARKLTTGRETHY